MQRTILNRSCGPVMEREPKGPPAGRPSGALSQTPAIFGLKSLVQMFCRPCENSMRGSVPSRGERFIVIFSALRDRRPRNSGGDRNVPEFSHGLFDFCTPSQTPYERRDDGSDIAVNMNIRNPRCFPDAIPCFQVSISYKIRFPA